MNTTDEREVLITALHREFTTEKIIVVEDLAGRLSLFAEGVPKEKIGTLRALADGLSTWSGDLANTTDAESSDAVVFEAIWEDAVETAKPNVRLLVRRAGHGDWFRLDDPLWSGAPYTAAFYSFKGGVGRTTAMLAFAIHANARKQSVFLIDADLDSPGLYAVFQDRTDSPPSQLGLVDYLLAVRLHNTPLLADYVSTHQLTESGADCYLLHGGAINEEYLGKLSRTDASVLGADRFEGFKKLMTGIREEYAPDWILLDTRSGLSDSAALATSGLFDIVVAVATDTDQNWLGIAQVISRLGKARIRAEKDQHDCLLVQSLVPAAGTAAEASSESFRLRAQEVFEDAYYVEAGADDDGRYISVDDGDGSDAPGMPVAIRINDRITQYNRLENVTADILSDVDYNRMASRLLDRYETSVEGPDGA